MIQGPFPVIDLMDKNTLMNLPKTVLVIALLLLVTACKPAHATPQIEWRAPAFEIAQADGAIYKFPDRLEGPTIILFWASWCPYCKALMPHLQSILDEYPGQVQVLALNFKDDDDPATYLKQRGFDFYSILHSENVAASWGVKGTPGLFLADRSGLVVFSKNAIPAVDKPSENGESLKHYQKAARAAPMWAAKLRMALDDLLENH